MRKKENLSKITKTVKTIKNKKTIDMKRVILYGIISIVLTAISFTLIYMIVSFYHMSTNPYVWGDGGRFIYLFSCIMSCLFTIWIFPMIALELIEKDK